MKCESKQQTAYAPAAAMHTVLCKFSNLTPMLGDKVEEWQADDDTCSFKVQGFTLGLRMDREAMVASNGNYTIKVISEQAPMDFAFWLQLKEVGAMETRLRVVIDVELNMMMKMMVGSKLQKGVDTIAEQIAGGFNQGMEQMRSGNIPQPPQQ